jgi:hypothetical protein
MGDTSPASNLEEIGFFAEAVVAVVVELGAERRVVEARHLEGRYLRPRRLARSGVLRVEEVNLAL